MGQPTHAQNGPDWWRSAVIYQVYVRSFADGDGDGTGDLAGVRARLPYLAELGVDALWFTPWYLSPLKDGGYDVADYRTIDPAFGTLAEAEKLIAEARELGIRTLVDIVPNHVSDQHPWFRAALAAGPGSPERELFHFRPGRGPHGDLRRTTGRRSSPAPPNRCGRGCPTATGACTCSRPNSPTSTGPTRTSAGNTRTSCGAGSSGASPASASTPPPCSPRTPTSPTSPRTRSRTRSSSRARHPQGAGRRPPVAGAARRRLPLPGGGAGPAGGRHPDRSHPGPHALPLAGYRPRPRRLPGAAALGRRPAVRGLRLPEGAMAAAAGRLGRVRGRPSAARPRFHAQPLPRGPRPAPGVRRGPLTWLPAPDGVLAFTRGAGARCVVNLAAAPVDLPAHSRLLLGSGPLDDTGRLPRDTAAWPRA